MFIQVWGVFIFWNGKLECEAACYCYIKRGWRSNTDTERKINGKLSPEGEPLRTTFSGWLVAKCRVTKNTSSSLSCTRLTGSPWAVCEPDRWRTSSSFPSYPSIPSHGPLASRCQWCSPPRHLGTGQESPLEWIKSPALLLGRPPRLWGRVIVIFFSVKRAKLVLNSPELSYLVRIWADTETLISNSGVLIEVVAAGVHPECLC